MSESERRGMQTSFTFNVTAPPAYPVQEAEVTRSAGGYGPPTRGGRPVRISVR